MNVRDSQSDGSYEVAASVSETAGCAQHYSVEYNILYKEGNN